MHEQISTIFDTSSASSYGEASLSWSSWSTSTTTADDESEQTATFMESAPSAKPCMEEYLHQGCPTLQSMSRTEHLLRRKTSFVNGASDFEGCELSIASNRLEDVIRCSSGDKSQKFLVFSSSFPYHIEWANSEWSKISGWSSDEVVGKRKDFIRAESHLLLISISTTNAQCVPLSRPRLSISSRRRY